MAVVGAGIGGLAAAHELQRLATERGLGLELVVLEASARSGGVLGSERYEGVLLERGPDSMVTHKPAGLALCDRLGLRDRLIFPPGRTDILHRGRLLPVPAGFALLAPTRWGPLLSSPLLSWSGKLRARCEPLVPARPLGDESVASFVRRRFGSQFLERLVEPMVGGITMADLDHLSLAATFPRFLALEREHGSLTGRRSAAPATAVRPQPAQAPPVAGLAGGLGQLVTALVERLPAGALRLGARVLRVTRADDAFRLDVADREAVTADAVLLATPAHHAGALCADLDPGLSEPLGRIAYASCVTVNLAWPRRSVERPPRSHGFFVPRTAGLPLVAAGFVDVKFPERVPDDLVVARVFFGGAFQTGILDRSDAELVALSVATLGPLLGVRESPSWSRTFRHPLAMPQPEVGHLGILTNLRARLGEHPGLDFAGGPFGAYGLPDSIAAGEAAAARLFQSFAAVAERSRVGAA